MIETSRLSLCRPSSQDISTLENLWRDEQVREFLGGVVSDDIIQQKMVDLQNHWDLHQFGQRAVFEKCSNSTEPATKTAPLLIVFTAIKRQAERAARIIGLMQRPTTRTASFTSLFGQFIIYYHE